MARGINKVILIGNLGADPETRYTQGGSPVTNFRIATSEGWKDKQSGENRERTEWHSCVTFGRLAEIAGEFLRKGSKVYVEGSLRTSSWETDGQTRYKTEIICNEMQMLDSRGGGDMPQSGNQAGGYPGGQSQPPQGGYGNAPQQGGGQPQRPAPKPAPAQGGQQQGGQQQGGQQQGQQQGNYGAPDPGSFDDFDDEIPF